MTSMNSRLATRAFWGLAGWGIPLVVVFFVTPLLLRTLGAEAFGILMTIFVAPLLAISLDFGLVTLGTRRVSFCLTQGKVDARKTLAELALLLGSVGALLSTALALGSQHIVRTLGFDRVLGEAQAVELILACAVWVFVTLLSALPMLVARAAQEFAWLAAAQMLNTAGLWLGALLLSRAQSPLTYVVILGTVLTLASALLVLIAVRQRIAWHVASAANTSPISDSSFATGTFVAQLAGALVFQGDRVIVAWLGTPALAGAYALCVNVTNKTLAAVVAMTSFVFPHASALEARQDRRQLESFAQSLDRSVAVIIAPVLAPGLLLADTFLRLWLGEHSFPALVTSFQILWLAFAIPAFAVPVSYLLAAAGEGLLPARFALLSAVVLLVGMPLLITKFGLIGAAAATFLSMSTSLTFNYAARRRLKLPHGVDRIRFWSGIGCGMLVQIIVLFLIRGAISSWIELITAAFGIWLIFFVTRAALRSLAPEEKTTVSRGVSIITRLKGNFERHIVKVWRGRRLP